ncbi:ribulose-5-phosphate 4-epimerase and related epimerase and aldolase [Gloeomargarita lithophora Alchichica-D10]|uniref:Ribulose-5-phosphate 4-epimerase and related epimerase and aldolase n=1 Tax=Gloeomargarita lithophora Alchichica-D10 TaxID=1188229 RepID=A0A1J0A9K4_9CYAN|nr:ribulose-5-phosphate 4-epimerase and related epimerase and aldolase [Gloeomargarita lithophora Alchichica-D10]
MAEDGVVKYQVIHQPGGSLDWADLLVLETWRQRLQQRGWLGQYPDGVSYGNVSQRYAQGGLVITATQVAHRSELTGTDYVLVTDYDSQTHTITVIGSTCASSEAPTHWGIYQLDPRIQVIFHIHCETLWNQLLQQPQIPRTPPEVPYGTQAMAQAMRRLYPVGCDPFQRNCLVMAGHQDGIFSFGRTAIEAGQVLFALAGVDHARLIP